MKAATVDIRSLLAAEGLIVRRRHPELAHQLDWLLRQGRLKTVLPGIYVGNGGETDFLTRLRAVHAWDPNAVVTGVAAAQATFWPQLRARTVEIATRSRRSAPAGFRLSRRQIPPELVISDRGIRCAAPALTALDLTASLDGDPIDTVLRSRQARLADLHEALRLTPGRTGNLDRRRLLVESWAEPWSAAERQLHGQLREHGITGWRGNYPLRLPGTTYFIDVAFPELRLAIEVDGRTFHGPDAFDRDRWRQNDIVLSGWRILRFSADMVRDQPELVLRMIEAALAA